jgi:hypothetical protein
MRDKEHIVQTERRLREAIDRTKWRGGIEDFEKTDAPLVVWDLPSRWLDSKYRETERRDVLREMLGWAMGADLIEGFPELNAQVLDQIVVPVRLAERGKRLALRAGRSRVVSWMAGLSEHGIQVKLFARSPTPDRFDVLDLWFVRPGGDFTKVITDVGKWSYGLVSEWRGSLPELILDSIRN